MKKPRRNNIRQCSGNIEAARSKYVQNWIKEDKPKMAFIAKRSLSVLFSKTKEEPLLAILFTDAYVKKQKGGGRGGG